VNSIKNKIISVWRRTKASLSFFSYKKKHKVNQDDLDRKLVYNLSPRKIPNSEQIGHLSRFLNPNEFLLVKICVLVVIINVIYLGSVFLKKHLQYLPIPGGEYIEGVLGYPQTINPLYAVNHGVDDDLARLIYSSLFKFDNRGNITNDLADNLEISADYKEYIVKIKNNVKWHDGSLLTADDVVFTFESIQNPDFRSPLRASLAAASIQKVDDITVKFTLSEPYSPFLELLTFGILPKNIWSNVNPTAATLSDLNLKPIGSGPFKFKTLVKNKDGELKEYNLIANDDYYGKKAYLKSIVFKFFTDYEGAVKALNDNEITGLGYLPYDLRKDLLAKNSLRFNELVQARVISIFFNTEKNKALANKDIRIALAKSLDKEQLLSDVFSGVYQSAEGPILKQNIAYNEALIKYDYSPTEAADFLQKQALVVNLSVVDTGSNLLIAEKIKNYWEKSGVKVNLNIFSSEQAASAVKSRNFELLLYGESVGGDPDVYAFWHSSQIGDKGLNLANYNNQEADKLLVEARAISDMNERIIKYKKFQEIITSDLPAIFLYSPIYTYVQGNNLSGFSGEVIVNPADRFNDISSWYLKTKTKITW